MTTMRLLLCLALLSPAALADGEKKPDPAAQMRESMNNLKQIGLAMILWNHNQGKGRVFPPLDGMLRLLWVDEVATEIALFRCPGWKTTVTAKDLEANKVEKLGYVATPWGVFTQKGSSEVPWVWSRPGIYPEGQRIVLFFDGHVETVSARRFAAILAATAKASEAHIRAGRAAMHHGEKADTSTPAERDAAVKTMAKAPTEAQATQLSTLIEALNARKYRDRAKARQGLQALGNVAITRLIALRTDASASLEQRKAAEGLLARIYDSTRITRRLAAVRARAAKALGKEAPKVEE